MLLARATAVLGDGEGAWTAEIAPGWDVMGNANGGYVLAIAARAAALHAERPDPVSVTAHYMRPARPGPVTIATEVLRGGRRFAVARSTLSGEAGPLVAVLGSYASLEDRRPDERMESGPLTCPTPTTSCL